MSSIFCDKLGPLHGICSKILDMYGPYILQILSRDIVSINKKYDSLNKELIQDFFFSPKEPMDICYQLFICNSSLKPNIKPIRKSSLNRFLKKSLLSD